MSTDHRTPGTDTDAAPSHRLVCRTDGRDANTLVAIETERINVAVWVDSEVDTESVRAVFDDLGKEVEQELEQGGHDG